MENQLTEADIIRVVESVIERGHESLLPAMRKYLEEIREVRMAMVREAKDIIQASRDLSEVTKQTKNIVEFAKAIDTLDRTLSQDVINKLNGVFKD